MKTAVVLTSILLLCSLSAVAQGRPWPQPPQPADRTSVDAKANTAPEMRPRVNAVLLQREARELSDLANSLPTDIDHVNQGLLPKDTIDKLKRIEKLSKHLRGEISP
jgi:hypothetical protein